MDNSKKILKQYWGYDEFRPPQDLIIQSVLDQKDTIALLPTGGGKSLCFQIPALLLEGKTIVISPLIALMQDQVDNLFARGIVSRSLNSNMRYNEIDAILDSFVYGDLKMLYISPERLNSEVFMTRITKVNLGLIAVDEAHCISQWGYDFRPSYFNIPTLRDIHPKTPIIALTATATAKVIQDIGDKLQLKNPAIFKKSFKRDNLSITIMQTEDKFNELLSVLSRVKGCAIIYVRNRKETIELAQWLSQHDITCVSYHGGMEKTVREKNQQLWMSNSVRLMVSTNAFGMGIDKADVRLVIHLDIAPSIEEYFQEAGRAGRDGKESYAVTIINESDLIAAKTNFSDQYPSIEIIGSVYDRLCRHYKVAYGSGMMETYDFNMIHLSEHFGINVKKLYHIFNILEKEGWVAFSEAFKEPSKIMVFADQYDLESMQRETSYKYKVLVHLLRKYEGLFTDYVKIDENRIAKEMHIEELKLVHYINLMKTEGILSYIPRASAPQITFTRERPKIEHFEIDKKSYQTRKKMGEDRLKAMFKMVENETKCRQKLIVEYFGEIGTDCKYCDICLGASKSTFTQEEIKKIYAHLVNTLQQSPINIKKYANIFPFNKRKRIIKTIIDLEAEQIIKVDNFGVISLNK